LTAVYDWKLPFMVQRLVGFGIYNEKSPNQYFFAEIVDPRNPNFVGALDPANTVAAANANNTTLTNNAFYRRFYIRDGDDARLTGGGPIAGVSTFARHLTNNRLADRRFWTPAYGAGASGSYFKGRVRTLIGWRHDEFQQNLGNDYFNWVTGEFFRVSQPRKTVIDHDSANYGAVVHFHKTLSAYANYAESVSLSSGIGGVTLVPGELTGPSLGSGSEYGLRWALFGGKLESNWTYFVTNTENSAANPALSGAVRTELGNLFAANEVAAASGTDTQVLRSSGYEMETVANLTPTWRLIWNLALNEVETSDRYPRLHGIRDRARAAGLSTPETDAFLSQNPDGTPIPGFTEVRSNLVTNFRFTRGPLRGFIVGGGFQYRGESYRGNIDLNRDGKAEENWSPGYAIWNAMLGYRTKLLNRNVNLSLNVNNVFDKQYFRSTSLSSGVWGEPRSLRFAIRTDL
jgi:outer membrane receptor for ferric coprogen and ferric-rhodotorulic acid